jgi:transcriptional regulator with XRE-family HTH domain
MLKKIRKEKKMSLESAAGSINKSASWLYKVENNTIDISFSDMERLMKVYGKTIIIAEV